MTEESLGAIVITEQPNFSWLTGGRGFIGLASETACASICVTHEKVYLIANNIEIHRLLDEELADLKDLFIPIDFAWWDDAKRNKQLSAIIGDLRWETDGALKKEMIALRGALTPCANSDYRTSGRDSAEVVEKSIRTITPGMTEFELAGKVSAGLWERGLEPATIMVAFDDRISRYRHPLPTMNTLKHIAMVVVCTRYHGLWVSLSRLAALGGIPDDLKNRHQAVTEVDATMILATRPGKPLNEIFAAGMAAYARFGFPEEWKLHHQGGTTAYQARENRVLPDCHDLVTLNQAYAWNPSIRGTKSEDTFIVTESCNEIITHTGQYAYMDATCNSQTLQRPDILILNN